MKATDSIKALAERWSHLRDVPFEDVPHTEVDILIGCDVPEAHWALDQRIGGRREPYAVRTVLGWTLCGPLNNGDRQLGSINYVSSEENTFENKLERFYNHEFGDLSDDRVSMSQEDRIALSIVTTQIRYRDSQFEIPLPWRAGTQQMPNNRDIALKRLNYLKGRLKKDPELERGYREAMERNIDLGYIERVTAHTQQGEYIWYLPHHPVINPKKPGKVRVVFDCAAKCNGVSLNDRLLQGPDLTTPLIEVLCRFRLGEIAVAADIREMFMQVKVPERHRDALRLLWWPEGNMDNIAQEYRMTVHPFGAVSSPFCANFALRETANQHLSHSIPSVASYLLENFYVDDFLGTFNNANEAIKHIEELSRLLHVGGFHLTKWTSNCRQALSTIPEGERSPSVREFHQTPLPTERTLGIQWDAEKDEFVFKLQLPKKTASRRGILSSLSSLYDPLGFVAPWLLPGKCLLQNLCRKKVDWDEPLDIEDQRFWQDWLTSLAGLGDIKVPRSLSQMQHGQTNELHLFSDASEAGYGVVAYVCSSTADGGWTSSLLFAKARVTPLKAVSIPRLELTAAVLSVRVAKLLRRCFKSIEWEVVYWTDSSIVLHYVNNVRTRFSTFVANRLAVIHEETSTHQWRHVRTDDNPADYCSRGLRNLDKVSRWFHGPQFLQEPRENWSVSPIPIAPTDALKVKNIVLATIVTTHPLLQLLERFSSWTKILYGGRGSNVN